MIIYLVVLVDKIKLIKLLFYGHLRCIFGIKRFQIILTFQPVYVVKFFHLEVI